MATGGTIASAPGARGSVAGLSARHLLGAITLPDGVAVEAEQLFQVNSFALTIGQMGELARRVRSAIADPAVDGVVVTHGTDTMEESAFLLSLVLDPATPVVFTGSQRTPDLPGADGARNLRDAITVAADAAATGLGTVVVFDGAIWAAAGTRKAHTLDTAAFDSEWGPVGSVAHGVVSLPARPAGHPLLPLALDAATPARVDIVPSYPGADTVALDAVIRAGAAGIVLEGMGAGNVGRPLADAVAALVADGIPVILSTRVARGEVAAIYGGGGGADLLAAGVILGGRFRAPQLRILLAVALAGCGSPAEATAAVRLFLARFAG